MYFLDAPELADVTLAQKDKERKKIRIVKNREEYRRTMKNSKYNT